MNEKTKQVTDVWKEFGSLINTFLIVIGGLTVVAGYGRDQESQKSRIDNNAAAIVRNKEAFEEALAKAEKTSLDKWAEHLNFHRERSNEASNQRGAFEQRIAAVEKSVTALDNLIFRLGSMEGNIRDVIGNRNLTDEKINKLVTDVAIIKDQLVGRTGNKPAQ